MRLAVVLVGIVACRGPEPRPTDPTDRAALCNSYDRRECLDSERCTLEATPRTKEGPFGGQYVCRPESGPCELDLVQYDKEACEKRGCEIDPGACFCPCRGYGRTKVEDKSGRECNCHCSGGPPSTCVPKGTVEKRRQATCVALSREECVVSERCTLVKVADGSKQCRLENHECEYQHVQTDESGCTARPGCKYIPADDDTPPQCVPAGGA